MNILTTRSLYVPLLILLAIIVATASQTFAVGNVNIGELDPTFNPVALNSGVNSNLAAANAVLVQPDGKILYGGNFLSVDRQSRNYIVRFNADGSVDSSFDSGGTVDGVINSMALQVDGKIVVAGNFSNAAGQIRQAVARLNADGSLDAPFKVNFTPPNALIAGNGITVQSDGKIVFTGNFSGPGVLIDGQRRDNIARVNADGSLDTTFTAPASCFGRTVVAQPDGKVLINSVCGGTGQFRISRLNSNGTLDTSFNIGTVPNGSVDTVVLQNDGKVLIGGQFTAFNGQTRNGFARLNANGSLDTAFNPPIPKFFQSQAIAIQADGKIIAAQKLDSIGSTDNSVLRINTDGTIDTTFNDPPSGYIYAIAVAPDGRIYEGGQMATFQNSVFIQKPFLRVGSDGAIDYPFYPFVACGDDAPLMYNIVPQPDGKIFVSGGFISLNHQNRAPLARLNADGSVDTSFTLPANVTPFVGAPVLQPDGKIIINGSITGGPAHTILRLNANGSLDTSFNVAGGTNGNQAKIALQPDGKIVVAGNFSTIGGQTRNLVARLNTDGSVDAFQPNFATSFVPFNSLLVQPDGKILLTGGFSSVNGTTRTGNVRFNADGSLDSTFANTNLGGASYLALQPDGKLIVSGGGVFRVNVDNTLDNSFTRLAVYVTTNNGGIVNTAAIQPDGKIVFGGNFYYVGNVTLPPHPNVVRVKADGAIDQTFINYGGATGAFSTAAAGGAVNQISLQPDGKILLAGQFRAYNNFGRFGLARLNVPAALPVTISGRVLTSDGRGLRNASVSMTDSNGVSRTATTSSFGFFSFADVPAGGQYVFRVQSRLFRYSAQTITVNDNLTLPDFVGLE